MNRPAIPAEIRRAVLVEAGHRCAISTCKYPSVDVHHIVPWEISQSHDYENLIALCPNCHRRADSGEIDRKSLRIYKARLGATVTGRGTEDSRLPQQWRIDKLSEVAAGSPGYEFEFEYPVFQDSTLAEVTNIVLSDGVRELQRHRRWLHDSDPIKDYQDCFDWHSASFEVVRCDGRVLSLNYRNSSYGVGAAHPNSYTSTYNFLLSPVRRVYTPDLFNSKIDHLEWLSKICAADLLKTRDSGAAHKWVAEGTAPEKNNFRSIAIDSSGLVVTFDAYQVDCYAAGPQVVHIPASRAQDALNTRLRILF